LFNISGKEGNKFEYWMFLSTDWRRMVERKTTGVYTFGYKRSHPELTYTTVHKGFVKKCIPEVTAYVLPPLPNNPLVYW
jgi:hypothetical protein